MSVLFDRADLADALRELIAHIPEHDGTITIRIVGGAALALRFFDRSVTKDIDVVAVRPIDDQAVHQAADAVAQKQGWSSDWINFDVMQADAIPQLGRAVDWEPIFVSDDIVIEVASPESLLAMKLRANRPGRDTGDIRQLMGLCGMTSIQSLETLYESFYPGDALPTRAIMLVEKILEEGVPLAPRALPKFTL